MTTGNDFGEISFERYIDGEMDAAEKQQFELYLDKSGNAQEHLRMAEAIKDQLAELDLPVCPPRLATEVLNKTAPSRNMWRGKYRFGLALAASLVIAVLVWKPDHTNSPPPEVEQAIEDAKWAVAFVSDLGRTSRTGNRAEILETGVVDPVQQALDYLFVSEKNED